MTVDVSATAAEHVTAEHVAADPIAAARAYLSATAGLAFDGARRSALLATLQERAGGMGAIDSYVAHVSSPGGVAERQALLDAVTVQETSFFRNAPQMEALRRVILPELLRRAAAQRRPFVAWSAGCATGEEPYSLAMMALEVRAALRIDVAIEILGTDVSVAALDAARTATYRGRTLAAVPPASRARWLCEVPAGSRVCDDVRALVTLRLHNLVTEEPPLDLATVDLVLCRNVTIYFARRTTRAVIGRLAQALRPEGYLLVGHAETLWRLSDAFALEPMGDAFAYRKSDPTEAPRPGGRTPKRRRVDDLPRVGAAASPPLQPATRPAARRSAADPTPRPDGSADLVARAREALRAGRYAQAVLESARAVDIDPLQAGAWSCLGQALTCRARDAEAISALRKAVYLDPGDGPAHFLLAGALARLGQLRAAGAAYEAAATALPRLGAVELAHVLDGRDVGELAALCHRLSLELR